MLNRAAISETGGAVGRRGPGERDEVEVSQEQEFGSERGGCHCCTRTAGFPQRQLRRRASIWNCVH